MITRENVDIFLSQAWIEVMLDVGWVSGLIPFAYGDETAYFGESRALGQKQWILYGTFHHLVDERLTALFGQAKKAGIHEVVANFNMSRWPTQSPLLRQRALIKPFGTYCVDLLQSEETLWANLHPKHRNMVRRAERQELVVDFSLQVDELHTLMEEAYGKGGRENPFSIRYLTALHHRLNASLLLATVRQDGKPLAAAAIPFDQVHGYWLHGATKPGSAPGAANLLHWHIMLRLKASGVSAYDLGGAREKTDDPRLQGIFAFKAGFGGPFKPCCFWRTTTHPLRHACYQATKTVQQWMTRKTP